MLSEIPIPSWSRRLKSSYLTREEFSKKMRYVGCTRDYRSEVLYADTACIYFDSFKIAKTIWRTSSCWVKTSLFAKLYILNVLSGNFHGVPRLLVRTAYCPVWFIMWTLEVVILSEHLLLHGFIINFLILPGSHFVICCVLFTGQPKGVELTHECLISAIAGHLKRLPKMRSNYDIYIGYLPLAHVLELCCELCCVIMGVRVSLSVFITVLCCFSI